MATGSTARRAGLPLGRLRFLAIAIATVSLVAVGRSTLAATVHRRALRIGIVGTGHMGGALATLWAKAGYSLTISSRHPTELVSLAHRLGPNVHVGTPSEAAKFGQVVLIAVPYGHLPAVGRELASELRGKIVIDCGNPYPHRDGPMALAARREGTGVASAMYLPGVRLVRAFNAISWINLAHQAHVDGRRAAIPIASNDPRAISVTEQLVRAAGFAPVVVGGLKRAKEFDVGTPVYVKLLTARQLRTALGLPLHRGAHAASRSH